VWRCLRDSAFSRFDTIPACDGRTDGHTMTANTTLAQRRALNVADAELLAAVTVEYRIDGGPIFYCPYAPRPSWLRAGLLAECVRDLILCSVWPAVLCNQLYRPAVWIRSYRRCGDATGW